MSIVLWRVMVLIVEGGIAGRPVHHARRLSVHHVAHRRIRTVCPARTCGQWWKHYTLLRLEHCSVIGKRVLEKLDQFPDQRRTLEFSTGAFFRTIPRTRATPQEWSPDQRDLASCVHRDYTETRVFRGLREISPVRNENSFYR